MLSGSYCIWIFSQFRQLPSYMPSSPKALQLSVKMLENTKIHIEWLLFYQLKPATTAGCPSWDDSNHRIV